MLGGAGEQRQVSAPWAAVALWAGADRVTFGTDEGRRSGHAVPFAGGDAYCGGRRRTKRPAQTRCRTGVGDPTARKRTMKIGINDVTGVEVRALLLQFQRAFPRRCVDLMTWMV